MTNVVLSRRALLRVAAAAGTLALVGTVALATVSAPAVAAPKGSGKSGKVTAATTSTTLLTPETTVATETTVTTETTTSVVTESATESPTAASTTEAPAAPTTTETTTAPATTETTETPATAVAPSASGASGMLIGTRNAGATDLYTIAGMNDWQGKTNAIVQTYVRSTWTPAYVTDLMTAIWEGGSVPAVSYDLQVTNPQVLAGEIDPQVEALAAAVKAWLAGPDAIYGNGDDRRAYFRPAWEGNGNWYRWSPCHYAGGTGTIEEFRAMWRHLHSKFSAVGVDRTRMSWIYSVNATDKVATCSAEALFPGNAYVDWTGIDGYTHTSTSSALTVFEPMTLRLRAIAPTKPVSINEWGADTATTIGKSAWIDAQFAAAHALGIRMNLSFNVDKERDWAVYGGGEGDETFTFGGRTLNGWSAYRKNVADSRVLGADASNPRLLSDAQFLGAS